MNHKYFLFIILAFLNLTGSNLQADEPATENTAPFQFSVKATTDLPIWLGLGAEVIAYKHFSLTLGYGFIPPGYADLVGSAVGSFSGNSGYKNLVTSLLQQNSAFKIAGEYKFSGRTGWLAGGGLYIFNASGDASIVEVLETLTGQTYTVLKNILAAQGKNPVAHSQSTIYIGEVHGGYSWALHNRFYARTSLGVAKVLDSSISLSSNAPNFDNSAAGRNAYANSTSSIQSTLATYGIAPIIEASLLYSFD